MHQKPRTRSLIFAILFLGLLSPVFAFAQSSPTTSTDQQNFSQNLLITTSADLGTIIARIINVALGFLGVVAVVLILYAGFLWMTSRGEDEKVKTAQRILKNSIIGLAIILSAFGIAQFIFRMLGIGGNNGSDIIPQPSSSAVIRGTGGGLGTGVVESHFPGRGAVSVPRNTRIIVTFKDAVNPASIAVNAADPAGKLFTATLDGNVVVNRVPEPNLKLRLDTVQIVKTTNIKNSVRDNLTAPFHLGRETTGALADVLVSFTPDLRTYVFTPVERAAHDRRVLLGASAENTNYTVYLCGVKSGRESCRANGIKIMPNDARSLAGDVTAAQLMQGDNPSGLDAFAGAFSDYEWSFDVGTFVDITPPTIASIVPLPDASRDTANATGRRDKPRNTIVQVNFSEPMLPTVMDGRVLTKDQSGQSSTRGSLAARSFDRMLVTAKDSSENIVAGNWQSGNQYGTVEFTSAELCGRNSCGQDVYCLPSSAEITVKLTTAAHTPGRDFTATAIVPDGLEDVAGNALDGNSNNRPDGSADYYDMACHATFGQGVCPAGGANKGDGATWRFWTSARIDLDPPQILSSTPGFEQGNTASDAPVTMTFSKPMSLVSLNSRTLDLSGVEIADNRPWAGWWDIVSNHIDMNGDHDPDRSLTTIRHGDFWVSTDFRNKVTHEVKDVYQNCYFPTGGGSCDQAARLPGDNFCCDGRWQGTACF